MRAFDMDRLPHPNERARAAGQWRDSRARALGLALLVSGVAVMLSACVVVPGYYVEPVAPAPIYVAPAPVYVAPAPVYMYGRGWRRY